MKTHAQLKNISTELAPVLDFDPYAFLDEQMVIKPHLKKWEKDISKFIEQCSGSTITRIINELFLGKISKEDLTDIVDILVKLNTFDEKYKVFYISCNIDEEASLDQLARLDWLRVLNISGFWEWGNFSKISKLRNLNRLIIYDVDTLILTPEIWKLSNLQTIYIKNLKSINFPAEIVDCKWLNELSIINSNLETCPSVIWEISSLKKLNLSQNKLSKLPYSIVSHKLDELNIISNNFDSVPEFKKYPNKLYISWNKLLADLDMITNNSLRNMLKHNITDNLNETIVIKKIKQKITKKEMQEFFDFLEKTGLNKLVASVFLEDCFVSWNCLDRLSTFKNLKKIEFDMINLKYIPIGLSWLKKLKSVEFTGTDTLPNNIWELTNIDNLSIQYVWSLPDSIWNLINLKLLNISNAKLTTVPTWINNLVNLEFLTLIHSEIETIADFIWDLTKLEYLDFSNNKIKKIPDSIWKLSKLKDILLYSNEITNIPENLLKLPVLENVKIRYNKLETLPESIFDYKWDLLFYWNNFDLNKLYKIYNDPRIKNKIIYNRLWFLIQDLIFMYMRKINGGHDGHTYYNENDRPTILNAKQRMIQVKNILWEEVFENDPLEHLKALYNIMILGEMPMITSSFKLILEANGLRGMARRKYKNSSLLYHKYFEKGGQKVDGYELLITVDKNKKFWSKFIGILAKYGRFEEFYAGIKDPEHKKEVINVLFRDIENNKDNLNEQVKNLHTILKVIEWVSTDVEQMDMFTDENSRTYMIDEVLVVGQSSSNNFILWKAKKKYLTWKLNRRNKKKEKIIDDELDRLTDSEEYIKTLSLEEKNQLLSSKKNEIQSSKFTILKQIEKRLVTLYQDSEDKEFKAYIKSFIAMGNKDKIISGSFFLDIPNIGKISSKDFVEKYIVSKNQSWEIQELVTYKTFCIELSEISKKKDLKFEEFKKIIQDKFHVLDESKIKTENNGFLSLMESWEGKMNYDNLQRDMFFENLTSQLWGHKDEWETYDFIQMVHKEKLDILPKVYFADV